MKRSLLFLPLVIVSALHAAPPTLEPVEYLGAPAFRLSDGRTEAVIVPQFSGRIMRYGAVGGRNWLWNSGPKSPDGKWTNLGGDKAFIGPHPAWKLFSERIWPAPFPSWDGAAHEAVAAPGARLRTSGPVWDGFGARITREFSFDESGALVIEQRIEKHDDAPVFLSAWTVSQAVPPEAVFIPLNPASAYTRGFHAFGKLPPEASLERLSPTLLRVKPTTGKSYKLGADSPVSALAAVAGRIVWVQRAELQPGAYPEGAEGAGFPIEFYNHGAAGAGQYVELEMLSPQRALKKGESLTLTVRWNLHALAAADSTSSAAHAEIEALLNTAPVAPTPAPAFAAADGAELYLQHCALCHGAEGRGIAGVFPPLAGADFLLREREKTLRAPLEGLSGAIEVNGTAYQGAMPPVALSDGQLAAVFSHVFSSWGNRVLHPTRDEIAAVRARTKFPTYEQMLAAFGTGQPPAPPDGWQWLPGVELNFSPVRLAAHPDGERVLLLAENGDVWSWKSGETAPVNMLAGASYLDASLGRASVLGMTVDRAGRLYLSSNQRNAAARPVSNEVTIFRTAPWTAQQPWAKPAPWLRTAYPFGVGPYNHGISHLAQGPDGMIYVNSGSRTDGGEAGTLPDYATTGEEPNTACLWRLNPADEKPTIEVFARGLRNTFGFCWDSEGRLLGVENGPDADAPEELNVIEQGRHYGFPFVFADWKEKAYPHTPDAPPGLTFTAPLRNLGPDAGGSAKGLSTFDPHSCPTGIVYLGRDWPAPLGGTFLTARFGNFLKGADVGFDVVQLAPDFAAGTTTAKRFVGPLGRPIDLMKLPGHRLVIAEHCRATTRAAGTGTPGRLLVLAPKPPATTPPPPPPNSTTPKP